MALDLTKEQEALLMRMIERERDITAAHKALLAAQDAYAALEAQFLAARGVVHQRESDAIAAVNTEYATPLNIARDELAAAKMAYEEAVKPIATETTAEQP